MNVGLLSCDLSQGIGLILEEKQEMTCTFTPSSGAAQTYTGVVHEYGLELGDVESGQMTWTVLAPNTGVAAGALAGTYAGAEADAALGLGAGANVLVGGGGRSITLQPLSVETEKGTALSAGVEMLELTAATTN